MQLPFKDALALSDTGEQLAKDSFMIYATLEIGEQ